jgi:glycosyltransferase involved in cell wall biosynthesis
MKILVVQDRLRSGGTERQSLFLCRAAAEAGHRAMLLTFRPGGALAAGPVATEALQPFDTGLDWFAPGLVARARRFSPDVAVCMGRMANCLAGRLQRALGPVPVVATLRTGKSLPWLFRRSLRAAAHVVANSEASRRELVSGLGLPAERITVIRNPLLFPPAGGWERDDAARAGAGAGPGTLVLLNVAMFRREKNQRELIEVAAGLPAGLDWQLWLAGDGPERGACVRAARRLGLGARVRFPGLVRDPSPLYRAADLAVHASWSESLSNFVIEAQAHGLPAVAFEARGMGECLIEGRTGWVIPAGDRAAFREAVVRAAGEPADRRDGRRAWAAAFARDAFDPDRAAGAHLALLAQLASRVR